MVIIRLLINAGFVSICLFLQVDVEEVRYITKELWHGRSARELFAKDVGRGMWRSVNELMLVRYGSFLFF